MTCLPRDRSSTSAGGVALHAQLGCRLPCAGGVGEAADKLCLPCHTPLQVWRPCLAGEPGWVVSMPLWVARHPAGRGCCRSHPPSTMCAALFAGALATNVRCLCTSLPQWRSTYNGEFEDVAAIDALCSGAPRRTLCSAGDSDGSSVGGAPALAGGVHTALRQMRTGGICRSC